jgi:hypothetical protein
MMIAVYGEKQFTWRLTCLMKKNSRGGIPPSDRLSVSLCASLRERIKS